MYYLKPKWSVTLLMCCSLPRSTSITKQLFSMKFKEKTEKQTCFTVWSSSSGMPKRMNRHSNKKLLFCCCLLCLQARNKSHLDILKPSRIAAILFVQPSFFVEQRTYFCIGHSKYVRVPSFAKNRIPTSWLQPKLYISSTVNTRKNLYLFVFVHIGQSGQFC